MKQEEYDELKVETDAKIKKLEESIEPLRNNVSSWRYRCIQYEKENKSLRENVEELESEVSGYEKLISKMSMEKYEEATSEDS